MRHVPIIVLVAVYLALATLYNAAIPLGEGPDEPGHAAFAFFLAETGRLPVQRLDERQTDVPGEGHQPPLAYALAAPLALWLAPEARQLDLIGNPRFTWAGGAEVNAVSHGSREYPPWQGAVLAWHLMRLVSAALGVATVVCTYLAARAVEKRLEIGDWRSPTRNLQSPMPLLAAGLVALNPQFLFVSALVTNDALLTALSAVLLWLIVREPRTKNQEPRTENREQRTAEPQNHGTAEPKQGAGNLSVVGGRWSVVVLGAVLGLALLTKQSAMILVPVVVLAVVHWRADVSWQVRLRRPLRANTRFAPTPARPLSFVNAALVLGVAALVSGWWYLRNQRLYGDLLGLAAFRGEFITQPFQLADPAAWLAALVQLHASFWARFGWMNVGPPAWVLWLIGAIELAAALGLIWEWRQGRRKGQTEVGLQSAQIGRPRWDRVTLWMLPALAFAWVVSFAITAGLVAWQGRLLFPALPAIAILLARGLSIWENSAQRTKNKTWLRHSLFLVLGSLFLLAAWLPYGVIRPAYPPQTLPPTVALAQIETPVYGQFRRRGEDGIDLRGWRIEGQPRPGAALDVTLFWFAAARQGPDWVVSVNLVDAQGQVVAEDRRQPRDGAFPTSQWNEGDWVADRHPLVLPNELAAGTYTLRVVLYDPSRENQQAGLYDEEGELIGEWLDLRRMIVGGE